MTFAVCLISVDPWRHVVHIDTERAAQIAARLLAERFPGSAFSYVPGPDLQRGNCHPSIRNSATSFEVRLLIETELVAEARANPDGLPRWCAFRHRNGSVCVYSDSDLRVVEVCRRDLDMVQERAIYARYPIPDEVQDCFRTEGCDDFAEP